MNKQVPASSFAALQGERHDAATALSMEARNDHRLGAALGWAVVLLLAQLALVCRATAQVACGRPPISWDAHLPLRWQHALLEVCDELGSSAGLDLGVSVAAAPQGRALQLTATASDGRTASRTVQNPDELLMTLQALVLVPPTSGPTPSPRPSASGAGVGKRSGELPLPAATSQHRSALPVEVGLALMGRVALAPEYLSPALALHAGLRFEQLTLGFDVRWNPFQTPLGRPQQPGLEVESLGAGLFATRRVFEAESAALDLGARAFLAADTRALEENEAATENTVVDGRVGLLARWAFGGRAARWMLSFDAELSPARLRAHGDFPAFSFGLGGGGVWEVK